MAVNKDVQVPMERFPDSSIRSIRCPNSVWDAAKERAEAEGVAMSYVVAQLVEGYSLGVFNMPALVKSFERASHAG